MSICWRCWRSRRGRISCYDCYELGFDIQLQPASQPDSQLPKRLTHAQGGRTQNARRTGFSCTNQPASASEPAVKASEPCAMLPPHQNTILLILCVYLPLASSHNAASWRAAELCSHCESNITTTDPQTTSTSLSLMPTTTHQQSQLAGWLAGPASASASSASSQQPDRQFSQTANLARSPPPPPPPPLCARIHFKQLQHNKLPWFSVDHQWHILCQIPSLPPPFHHLYLLVLFLFLFLFLLHCLGKLQSGTNSPDCNGSAL